MRRGWAYIMANRHRGGMYVGATANLPERIYAHREGRGSVTVQNEELVRELVRLVRLVWAERCDDVLDAIAHEKRLKRWRREWKFALIERANPDWADLFDTLVGED